MTDFELFFSQGFSHITDINGIDHILFIAALTAQYVYNDWKKLLILITAFTIGHSITLLLSSLDIIEFRTDVIEFLIPVTIFITAAYSINDVNNPHRQNESKKRATIFYTGALLFGLIHGLGFSNYLKSLFGRDESVVMQLLSFNLGLEAGQLIIVAILLLISFIFVRLLKLRQINYVRFICIIVLVKSVQMCIQRFPF